jgi:ribonuclease G
MNKEILITADPQEKRVVIVKDKVMEEFYIERPQDKTIVGNIYKGIIEAVIPSINGAFVDIGLPKKGFLYLTEIEDAYDLIDNHDSHVPQKKQPAKEVKKGQEVLVQVVKESFGTKGPRLSCHIGIAGRFLVLMPLDNQTGVSRRIEDDEERRRLRQILQELKLPKEVGFIVRTVASGKNKNELMRDAIFLIKLWKRVEKTIKRQKAPSLIYEEYDLTLRVIRDSFSEDVAKLIVDSKPEFYRIQKFMGAFMSNYRRKVEYFRGADLFAEKDVERQINKIFEKKVYMKSKAYIIIEPTEGLVVIDVNSGGFKDKVNQEEAAFRVNCEAAIESAHQLRLRDLGGIIVIDFIDMEKEFHRREVLRVLKEALNSDRAKYDILGISKFGLVEMTRERIHNTVQTLSFRDCPYCGGKGRVKSPTTMAIFALKELRKYLKDKRLREVTLTLNPEVAAEIARNKENVRFVERSLRVKLNLIPNPALKIEDISIS